MNLKEGYPTIHHIQKVEIHMLILHLKLKIILECLIKILKTTKYLNLRNLLNLFRIIQKIILVSTQAYQRMRAIFLWFFEFLKSEIICCQNIKVILIGLNVFTFSLIPNFTGSISSAKVPKIYPIRLVSCHNFLSM